MVPLAPGTAGTVIAVPIYLIFSPLSWPLYLVTVAALTCLAVYASQEAEKIFNEKDAPRIVIDEIAGFQWAMFLVAPTVPHVILGFMIFRFFDIVKIFPAGYCQRRFPGGWGVVADDCVAGVYTNAALLLLAGFGGI